MNMITSHNVILPKYLRIVKKKGSRISKTRARVGWGKGDYSFFSLFGPAVRSQKILAVQSGGRKGRELGGRNFRPPVLRRRRSGVGSVSAVWH